MCAEVLELKAGSRGDRLRVQWHQGSAEQAGLLAKKSVTRCTMLEIAERMEQVAEGLMGLTEEEKRDSVSRGARYDPRLDLDSMIMVALGDAACLHFHTASSVPPGEVIELGRPPRVAAVGGDFTRATRLISKV